MHNTLCLQQALPLFPHRSASATYVMGTTHTSPRGVRAIFMVGPTEIWFGAEYRPLDFALSRQFCSELEAGRAASKSPLAIVFPSRAFPDMNCYARVSMGA